MSIHSDESGAQRVQLIKKLMLATAITEPQADELVAILGTDWSSPIREARNLKR